MSTSSNCRQPFECGSWSSGSWTSSDYDESPRPSQCGSLSSDNYDLRKEHAEVSQKTMLWSGDNDDDDDDMQEEEEHAELSQKTMLKIENPDCKQAAVVESLVAAQADLERKDQQLGLLREFLNETIKELQADVLKWRTKYLHAKMILHLNGIPLVDS